MANNNLILIVAVVFGVFLLSGGITGNAFISQKTLGNIQTTTSLANLPSQVNALNGKVTSLSSQLSAVEGALMVTRNDLLNHIGSEEIANLETPEPEPLAAYSCVTKDPNFKVCGGTCNPTTQGACKSGDFFTEDRGKCMEKGYAFPPCPGPDGILDGCYCY